MTAARDLHSAAADLLRSALTVDSDGDVTAVDLNDARYAIDQARLVDLDVGALLDTQQWAYRPDLLLRIVCADDAIWERECRLHAVWCARQVRHLWRPQDRTVLEQTLEVAERFAHGQATVAELTVALAAAWAAARASDGAAGDAAGAAGAAAGDAAGDAWAASTAAGAARAADGAAGAADGAAGAAQQRRLIARAKLLDAGEPS